jgi:hypothetical protein
MCQNRRRTLDAKPLCKNHLHMLTGHRRPTDHRSCQYSGAAQPENRLQTVEGFEQIRQEAAVPPTMEGDRDDVKPEPPKRSTDPIQPPIERRDRMP